MGIGGEAITLVEEVLAKRGVERSRFLPTVAVAAWKRYRW